MLLVSCMHRSVCSSTNTIQHKSTNQNKMYCTMSCRNLRTWSQSIHIIHSADQKRPSTRYRRTARSSWLLVGLCGQQAINRQLSVIDILFDGWSFTTIRRYHLMAFIDHCPFRMLAHQTGSVIILTENLISARIAQSQVDLKSINSVPCRLSESNVWRLPH